MARKEKRQKVAQSKGPSSARKNNSLAKLSICEASSRVNVAKRHSYPKKLPSSPPALYPVPEGLNYLLYQRDAIAFALDHEKCLIADEMGLGKTVEAIGMSNALPSARRTLVVCPASLKLNWQREWERWDVKHLSVGIVNGNEFPDANVQVVIINYDLLKRHAHA